MEHVTTLCPAMLFYARIMRNLRRNCSMTILVVVTLILCTSVSAAQSIQLNNLPAGNESNINFEDRYVSYRPAFTMNGFDCSQNGATCAHGLGLKQILEELATVNRQRDLVQAIFDLAGENLDAPTGRRLIARNTQRAQSIGFAALATLVLEQNGYGLADIGIASEGIHSDVMASLTQIVTNLPMIQIDDEISDDAVKWVGTLGNISRFVDAYLALERAYQHYELDGGGVFGCEIKSDLLRHLEEQFRLVNDMGNRGLVDLDFLKPIGLPSNITGADYDEVQAGNWSMKVHATVGYAALAQQIPTEGSCSSFIPEDEDTYTQRVERAFRSTGPNDDPERKHHWAFQTDNGKRFWAEGAFYFNYGLASVLPFWQTVRAQQIDGFDWEDPFVSDWFLEPLRGYAETVDPNGFVPPLDDGNKIPMEAAFMMRWDDTFSSDGDLGQQFAWIAAAQEELPGEDNWLNILLLPTATALQSPVPTVAPGNGDDPHQIVIRRDGGSGSCDQLPESRTSPCHYLLFNGEPEAGIEPGEGHEQSDQMQLLYYVDGTSFLMDAGYDNAPGIKNSTWSDYRYHNVMTTYYDSQGIGHGGLSGPKLGIKCPIMTPCQVGMFAEHPALEEWGHNRTGHIDMIQGRITIETDTNPDTTPTEVIYDRTVLFIDDTERPYLIDINAAEWTRPDGDLPGIPVHEMRYFVNTNTIDLGGEIRVLGNGGGDEEPGGMPTDTGSSLFMNRFAVEGGGNRLAVPDTVRESSESGIDRGEGRPVWRLMHRSPGEGRTPDFTTVSFIQPQIEGLDQYACRPSPVTELENGNREGDAGVYAWQSSANTVDVVFVRAAGFPRGLPYAMSPNLETVIQASEWEVDPGFMSNGLILNDGFQEVVLEADYRAGFVRFRRLEEIAECTVDVGVKSPQSTTFNISESFPNPVVDTAAMDITLDAPQQVRIDIFDLLGRRVQQLTNEWLPAGPRRIVWDATSLPAGSYIIRYQVGDEVQTRQVAVL